MFNIRSLMFKNQRHSSARTQPIRFLSSAQHSQFARKADIKNNDVVLASIKPFAQGVSRLTATHYLNEVASPRPAVRKLLTRPNDKMTFQQLIYRTMMQVKLEGNAYLYIRYSDENREGTEVVEPTPIAIHLLEPTNTEAVMHEGVFSIRFRFSGDVQDQIIPYGEIIHLRDNFADGDFFAPSPVEPLRPLLESMALTDHGMKAGITRSLPIRWIMSTMQSLRPEDLETHRVQTEELINKEENSVVAHDAKFKVEPVQNFSTPWLPDVEIQKSFRQRVFEFMQTNEGIVSKTATEEEQEFYYNDQILPMAQQLSEEFTAKLFSEREQAHGNSIRFEAKILATMSVNSKLNLTQLVDRGLLGKEEFRESFGLSNNEEHLESLTFMLRREYLGGEEFREVVKGGGMAVEVQENQNQTPTENSVENE